MQSSSFTAIKAGAIYFAAAFALGFVLGTIRVLWLAPHVGETAAVLAEQPVMLTVSWFAAGWLIRRHHIARARAVGDGSNCLCDVDDRRVDAGGIALWPDPAPMVGRCDDNAGASWTNGASGLCPDTAVQPASIHPPINVTAKTCRITVWCRWLEKGCLRVLCRNIARPA